MSYYLFFGIMFCGLSSLLLSFVSRFFSLNAFIIIGKFILLLSIIFSSFGFFSITVGHQASTQLLLYIFEWLYDPISITFFLMVSIIGWAVLHFSKNYLWGDALQKTFIERFIFTVGVVQTLMISGNLMTLFLAWFLSDVGLRKLIALYEYRKYALITERKKMVVSTISNFFMLMGIVIFYLHFHTLNLNELFKYFQIRNINDFYLELAAVCFSISAIVKSANIPFHGWVLGMMEAPTPVSGILHAGLLNAGPFLIIRFHSLFDYTHTASYILIIWGGISALYGTLVSYFQPAVKTRLSYSSVGHMGFSLMLGGLGIYSAAVLHLIGHSFYKAHAFLSSGSDIDKYRVIQTRNIYLHKLSVLHIISGFLIGISFYFIFLWLFKGTFFPSYSFFVLGFIVTIGISTFIINTLVYVGYIRGWLNIVFFTLQVFLSFFVLEWATEHIVAGGTKDFSNDYILFISTTFIMLMFIVLSVYSVLLKWKFISPIPYWDVYVRNGFYLHTVFDNLFSGVKKKIQ